MGPRWLHKLGARLDSKSTMIVAKSGYVSPNEQGEGQSLDESLPEKNNSGISRRILGKKTVEIKTFEKRVKSLGRRPDYIRGLHKRHLSIFWHPSEELPLPWHRDHYNKRPLRELGSEAVHNDIPHIRQNLKRAGGLSKNKPDMFGTSLSSYLLCSANIIRGFALFLHYSVQDL